MYQTSQLIHLYSKAWLRRRAHINTEDERASGTIFPCKNSLVMEFRNWIIKIVLRLWTCKTFFSPHVCRDCPLDLHRQLGRFHGADFTKEVLNGYVCKGANAYSWKCLFVAFCLWAWWWWYNQRSDIPTVFITKILPCVVASVIVLEFKNKS